MRLQGLAYYARSVPTLLLNIAPRAKMVSLFLGRALPQPLTIRLRGSGLQFRCARRWMCGSSKKHASITITSMAWHCKTTGRSSTSARGWATFTTYAARCSPHGRMLAFEPSPESFALLKHNLQINGMHNVEAQACAVADATGKLLLNVDSKHATQHTITAPGTRMIEVRAITLSEVFEAHGLDRCDFLKMDIEGGEYAILRSAEADVLKRVQRIALEYHDNTPAGKHAELVRLLQASGFQVQVRANPVHDYLGLLVRDEKLNLERSLLRADGQRGSLTSLLPGEGRARMWRSRMTTEPTTVPQPEPAAGKRWTWLPIAAVVGRHHCVWRILPLRRAGLEPGQSAASRRKLLDRRSLPPFSRRKTWASISIRRPRR